MSLAEWTPDQWLYVVCGIIVCVASTLIPQMILLVKAYKAGTTLEYQNQKLQQIETKVNGGTERAMQALKDQHAMAVQQLQKEAAAQRHAKDNEINALKLQLMAANPQPSNPPPGTTSPGANS